MYLPQFQYLVPETIDELTSLLAEHREKAKILSGGTDLLILMKDKAVKADYLIDISRLNSLHGISYEEGRGLAIGAATKIEVIERSPLIYEKYHALHQGARAIGSPQVRAMGSIGGNCCNALPAADTPPPLVALGAKVQLVSKRGRREMPLEDFIRGNRVTAIEQDEFLENLLLDEPWPNSSSRYLHIGLREAMEVDMASMAVNMAIDPSTGKVNNLRIVMGAVGPTPLRALKAEGILMGKGPDDNLLQAAADSCAAESRPIDDFRASAAYRREVLKVLFRRAFQETLAAVG